MSDSSSSTTATTSSPLSTPWRPRSTTTTAGEGKDRNTPSGWNDTLRRVGVAAAWPSWTALCVKTLLGVTVGLYVLNQKHLLPKPLSRLVSKALFWPTLPLTVSKRLGAWTTVIDETVVMGGAPFGFAAIPEQLYHDYGVRGVVNFCEEYTGPAAAYQRLGMTELHVPTADHFEPTVADLEATVRFIKRHQANKSRVYVHCRAGHGRSAAGVFAWLLAQDPTADPQSLNQYLCSLRNVRKTLWKQGNIRRFHDNLKEELQPENDEMDEKGDEDL